MKKILILLFIISFNMSNAQSKEMTFTAKEKRVLYNATISENGTLFLTTAKNLMSVKSQKEILFKFDKDFNKIFEVAILPSKKKRLDNKLFNDLNVTEKGDIAFYNYQLFDNKGKSKNYHFKKNLSGNVNKVFGFYSDTYQSFIGPLLGRKNYKKKYSAGDIYIFSRKFSDYSITENKLQQLAINSNLEEGDVLSWSLGVAFDDYFNMLTKDKINKDRTVDTYHIVSNKYNGEVKSYTPLTVKLDTGHFLLSTNGGPAVFSDSNFGNFASGNIYTDVDTGDLFVYGFYTDRAKRKMISGHYKGFYIYKFNSNGKEIWKKQISFKEHSLFKKSMFGNQVGITLHRINKDAVIMRLTSADEGFLLYQINLATSKLENFIDIEDFEYKIKKYRRPYMNKDDFPKKYFTIDAVTALKINKNVSNYISKLDPEVKIYIDAHLIEDGSIILSHYDVKNTKKISYNSIKFLRFDE